MAACKKEGEVELFLDLHGHSVLKNSFIYGPAEVEFQRHRSSYKLIQWKIWPFICFIVPSTFDWPLASSKQPKEKYRQKIYLRKKGRVAQITVEALIKQPEVTFNFRKNCSVLPVKILWDSTTLKIKPFSCWPKTGSNSEKACCILWKPVVVERFRVYWARAVSVASWENRRGELCRAVNLFQLRYRRSLEKK